MKDKEYVNLGNLVATGIALKVVRDMSFDGPVKRKDWEKVITILRDWQIKLHKTIKIEEDKKDE